jgi:hypothetical protein
LSLRVRFLVPCFFLFYINDLPKIITKNNSIVVFADDTSLVIIHSNKLDFNTNINQSLHNIISWFNSNLLVLNFNKTHYVEFRTKNYYEVKTKVTFYHINISNSTETKFLGLIIDETLSWNQYVYQLATKLLCPKKSKTYCTSVYSMNNILRLYTFHFKLQHNFLGEIFKY